MEITTITSLNDDHVCQLVSLFKNEFWCNKRDLNDVISMLKNTDIVIGVVNESDELIGFVRVLTDFVYKATIYDLIVHSDWRSKKIGKLLMDEVITHSELQNVEHFDLNCLPEMYPFYEKWNFTQELGELGFMRKFNRQ
jgi:ribosomal protein S18 acetylase RimI-like enzyme